MNLETQVKELVETVRDLSRRLDALEADPPPIASKAKARDLAEVTVYCLQRGLTPADGQWFWDKMLGSGWKNDGHAVRDWRATVRSWQAIKIFPSQKPDAPKVAAKTDSRGLFEACPEEYLDQFGCPPK